MTVVTECLVTDWKIVVRIPQDHDRLFWGWGANKTSRPLCIFFTLPAEQACCVTSMLKHPPKRAGGRTRNLATSGTVYKESKGEANGKRHTAEQACKHPPNAASGGVREAHVCSAGRVEKLDV